jgi:PTS system mannose-specific IIA component|tara:strand:- start:456 stop:851 length:396 start_codon:yes stop_codon:yes gene_type:complete
MIGLVLVTHGRLAEEFVAAMEHVVGKQENIATVCMFPDDDIEKSQQAIQKKIKHVDTGKGVILLTDMFGGTPSNLAIALIEDGKIEALAGINLPMLVKLASIRTTHSLKDAVIEAQDAGRKYIHAASTLLD